MSIISEIPGVVLESASCPNDCSSDDQVLFVAHDWLFGLPGNYPVVRCNKCGQVRTDPRPTPATIGFYYPPEKYCAYLTPARKADNDSKWLRRFLIAAYHKVFCFNENELPDIPPGKMLEIGCSSGTFLAKMAAKNWRVEGIELSKSVADQALASGFNVFCGSVESAPNPKENFDLIVGWMVIEHLHDPILSLYKLANWGNPGCWLVISIPNASNFNLRLFKDKWWALQVPTHLYHFSEKTITSLLSRSGWRVERVLHRRSLDILAHSIGYILENCGMPPWLAKAPLSLVGMLILFPISFLLAAFKQGGVMIVWAKKDDIEKI
jgi:SAM-dependent methyltransferase